ncbi:MAG: GerMN domain-containing protein [Spirochaetaceae bacterium]
MQKEASRPVTDKFLIAAVGLLAAAFLISLVFFLTLQWNRTERVLFFAGNMTREVGAERRIVTNHHEPERDTRLLVEEVLLGPTSLYRSRVLPKQTRLQLFVLRDDIAYIDLSREALFPGETVLLDVDESIAVLRYTLRYNFRFLDDVVVTIDGQLPYEPPYVPENGQNEA